MAKRFIDTEIFMDEWFTDLPNKYKLLWFYLITNCDNAGIFKVSYKIMKFHIGENLEPSEVKRVFTGRIVEIEPDRIWFLPKFLLFQYPKGLASNKPAIVSVREKLQQFNLFPTVKEYLGNDYLIIPESLSNRYATIKDKDKDKNKDKDKDKSIAEEIPTDIQQMFVRTLGRNPKIPEVEETEKLIASHGRENVYQVLKAAALRGINSFGYLQSQLEVSNGKLHLKPYNGNGKQATPRRELKDL